MEIEPFLKLTSSATALRKLPQALFDKGYEIRILMPKFGVINERRNRLHEVVRLSGINIRVADQEKPLTIKVASIPNARLQVYFLDNEDYFKRRAVFTSTKGNKFFEDNDERVVFFCKGLIETVRKLGWQPHVVHCHGWMTGLLPLYIKTHYREDPIFKQSKVLFTAYNHDLSEPMPAGFLDKAKLDGVPEAALEAYRHDQYFGVLFGAMTHADAVARAQPNLPQPTEDFIAQQKLNVPFDHGTDNFEQYVEFYHQLYQQLFS